MTDGERPGPPGVLPALAPGGVVIQVYAERDLVVEQRVSDPARAYRAAADAFDLAEPYRDRGARICLVAFDGDTGERIHDWGASAYAAWWAEQ